MTPIRLKTRSSCLGHLGRAPPRRSSDTPPLGDLPCLLYFSGHQLAVLENEVMVASCSLWFVDVLSSPEDRGLMWS